ncbi:MAG: polyprenyl synthetase family protein [Patescibacteria group bacterium]
MSSSFSSLKTFRKETTPRILKTLEDFFDNQLKKAEEKDEVLLETVQLLKEFTLRGGKRVGPLMVILGYQLAQALSPKKSEGGDIIRAAVSVEIHHLYLLNLDDMADRDILRHGGKTLEEYYRSEIFQAWPDKDHHGRTFSSIAGALLNSFTFELIRTSGFEAEKILAAEGVIIDMLFGDTVAGWQIQYFQNNESISTVSEKRFLKGLEFVTSRYKFVGTLLIGLALALDPSDEHFPQLKQIFTEYGKHVGIAFQIQDDILGLFGDPKETGKAVGNDVREGKKTLLIQYAYRNGNAQQRKLIESALNTPLSQTELEKIQKVVTETGSLAYSHQLAEQHVLAAVTVLEPLASEFPQVQVLRELAQYMIQRSV